MIGRISLVRYRHLTGVHALSEVVQDTQAVGIPEHLECCDGPRMVKFTGVHILLLLQTQVNPSRQGARHRKVTQWSNSAAKTYDGRKGVLDFATSS